MSLRGKAAIVGIGETPHKRSWPGRSALGLCAEVAAEAIKDAGLRREDIDGLITMGGIYPARVAEYIGIRPVNFAVERRLHGLDVRRRADDRREAVSEGIANYILFVAGGARDPENPQAMGGFRQDAGFQSEWFSPFGPAAGANTYYALLYTRHMYQYGTKPEQMAQVAVNQRFNAGEEPAGGDARPDHGRRRDELPLHQLPAAHPRDA